MPSLSVAVTVTLTLPWPFASDVKVACEGLMVKLNVLVGTKVAVHVSALGPEACLLGTGELALRAAREGVPE